VFPKQVERCSGKAMCGPIKQLKRGKLLDPRTMLGKGGFAKSSENSRRQESGDGKPSLKKQTIWSAREKW